MTHLKHKYKHEEIIMSRRQTKLNKMSHDCLILNTLLIFVFIMTNRNKSLHTLSKRNQVLIACILDQISSENLKIPKCSEGFFSLWCLNDPK